MQKKKYDMKKADHTSFFIIKFYSEKGCLNLCRACQIAKKIEVVMILFYNLGKSFKLFDVFLFNGFFYLTFLKKQKEGEIFHASAK